MFDAIRTACQTLVDGILRIEVKLDGLLDEVRLRNAQHDLIQSKLDYLIAVEHENRRRIDERDERERTSIVMPMPDERM